MRPCLDCEANPFRLNYGQLGAWYLAAVTRIVAKLGCYPTLYGSKDYLQNFAVFAPHVFGRCPLWLAAYIPRPVIPAPWHAWQAWQWTSSWRDRGIPGGVDDSLVSDLAAFRIPGRVQQARVRHAAKSLTPAPWSLKPLPVGP